MAFEENDDRRKHIIGEAMTDRRSKYRWMKYRAVLHLHSEEVADRLTTLLAQHLLLDHAVTAVLSLRLRDPRTPKSLDEVVGAVRRVNFNNRIEIAKASQLISESCAADIKAVNKVRNNFAHHKSAAGGGVSVLPELESSDDFERCMERGERALDELLKHISEHLEPST